MNRNKHIKVGFKNVLINLVVLSFLYFLLGVFSIIPFFILLFSFLPSPYIKAPKQYMIDQKILHFGKQTIKLEKVNFVVKKEESYISIRKWWMVEIVRLYSKDLGFLENILKNST